MLRYTLIFLLLAPLVSSQVVPGRYLVELTGDSVVEHVTRQRGRGGLRGAAAAERRSALRTEQARVRTRMGAGVQVLAQVENVGNALIVAVDDAEAGRLATLPGVLRVEPVRTVKRMLDRAVVVNKVVGAWNEVGDDRAGEGIKVGIIDSGVDNTHPGFRDMGMAVPATFPRTNRDADGQFTNQKVIVARSYVNLLARRDTDESARDRVGHGTALGMAVAGGRTVAPLATIQGVAPRAFLGSYKVFGTPGENDTTTNAAILKAIDDAVADGMDILNLSLGNDVTERLESDALVLAVERAVKAGVLVVCASGNNGPDFGTVSSPGTAPSAITVGATRNDRTFGTSVDVEGLGAILTLRGSGVPPENPVTGPLADVAVLDRDGLACGDFASGSLAGKVALIQRGTCTFEVKLNNAQRAGAVGAIVYAREEAPEPLTMAVGAATLPAQMVSYSNGALLKERGIGATATLRFVLGPVPQAFDRLTSFSGIGPNVDLSMKPELVAVGGTFYTATQSADPEGDMYRANGYIAVDGTSFSAPLAAGALALLKAARPGLSVDQYRSLLINAATPVEDPSGNPAGMQKMGAGQLNVQGSLGAWVAAVPATLSLGIGAKSENGLRLENLGSVAETYSLIVEPRKGGAAPALSANMLTVAAGGNGELRVTMDSSGLEPGSYEGYVRIVGAATGTEIRVPYWFAVRGAAAAISLIEADETGRRSGLVPDAFFFRVTDAAGIPLTDTEPEITVVAGEGSVVGVNLPNGRYPGLYSATVRLGPTAGVNTFRIKAGEATRDVNITAP
jgi:subtilisin family serine protease